MDARAVRTLPTPAAPAEGIRLTLRIPGPGERATVDGVWWPRSTDLAAELPALVSALDGEGVAVSRIAFALDAWDASPPRRVAAGGRTIRTGGFRVLDPMLVSLTRTARGRPLDLLVVSPGTQSGTAAHALMTATSPAMLRKAVAADAASRSRGAPDVGRRGRENAWDSEGGHLAANQA
jgi:hypothetical protein